MEQQSAMTESEDGYSTKESAFQASLSEKKIADGWPSSEAPSSTNIAEVEKDTNVLERPIDESPLADEASENYLTGFKLAIILTATCLSVFLVALVCTAFSTSSIPPPTDQIPGQYHHCNSHSKNHRTI
jgi:hypothetical protein